LARQRAFLAEYVSEQSTNRRHKVGNAETIFVASHSRRTASLA
jgi:hypothetical protein